MNTEKLFDVLVNKKDWMLGHTITHISNLLADIKSLEGKLEYLENDKGYISNKPYIVYKEEVSDSDADVLEYLVDRVKRFRDKEVELFADNKYLDVSFYKIRTKQECPEIDVKSFTWLNDDEEDTPFIFDFDGYEGWHTYGEIWALIVIDKATGNPKDTLEYKNLVSNLLDTKNKLKEELETLKIYWDKNEINVIKTNIPTNDLLFVPYGHSRCFVCGGIHPNGLPCPLGG